MPMDRQLASQKALEVSLEHSRLVMQQIELAWEEGFQAGQKTSFDRESVAREIVELRECIATVLSLVRNISTHDKNDEFRVPGAERIGLMDATLFFEEHGSTKALDLDDLIVDTVDAESDLEDISERLGKLADSLTAK